MRKTIAACIVALSISILAVPAAGAAPTEVNVRIEGMTETLFEGPILTEAHKIRAASDKKARTCDGTNNSQHPAPGPTPTAVAVDAMSTLDPPWSFDGQWYNQYDDYFIKRWGPDGQDEASGAYWGIVVNNLFTSVGGCQYQLDAGDEVLWVYDAFKERPQLALFPAGYAGGARPLTAGPVEVGEPFEVEVDSYEDDLEDVPPASPERAGSTPFTGATVAPVASTASGFERVEAESPQAVLTDSGGEAPIVFSTPGWHRIKATVPGVGDAEDAIRSNRLDVCVTDPPAVTDCGTPLADDLPRIPPMIVLPPDDPEPVTTAASRASSAPPADDAAPVRLQLPRLDRSRIERGLVEVSWRVLDPGVGIKQWTIASKRLGAGGNAARYVTRARGAAKTSALVRLPPGAIYRLRLRVVDALGRSSNAPIGTVRVPAGSAAIRKPPERRDDFRASMKGCLAYSPDNPSSTFRWVPGFGTRGFSDGTERCAG